MLKSQDKSNCLFLYGGGLIDAANCFLRTIAEATSSTKLFQDVYVGFYSFESLLDERFILRWSSTLKKHAEGKHGGYFGTSRGVDLTEPELQKIAIQQCKARNIEWVFVAGGDGSSRQVAEIAPEFEKMGIKFGFILPCTVDGIEGGYSLGINMATRAYVQLIREFANSTLCTRDNRKFSVSAVVLQGRNRDDLLAHVLREIEREPIAGWDPMGVELVVVPANSKWNREVLVKQVEESEKPVLLLVSEGATLQKSELHDVFPNKKVRIYSVGHLSQVNGNTTEEDIAEIYDLCNNMLLPKMVEAIKQGKPFNLAVDENIGLVRIEPVDYFAKKNPREEQNPTLEASLEALVNIYLPKN